MFGLDSSSLPLFAFAGAVVIGAIVMYLVSLISMKETSFESILEEQRKKKEKEDKERSMQNKQKREQYKKKFDQKKKRGGVVGNGKIEKSDSGVSPMHEVQIRPTPVVQSVQETTQKASPVEAKKPKTKPAKKQEPAVQPKQQSPKPSEPEQKITVEKPKSAPVEVKVEVQKKKQERNRTVSFSDDVQEKQKADFEPEKSKKKKKKAEQEVESAVVAQLRESTLSDRDVQNVLTLVRQKHGIDIGGGNKIKDLQQQLEGARKKLAQSEAGLEKYVALCMSNDSKIGQLKQDLVLEKTKCESLQKAMQDEVMKNKQEKGATLNRHLAEIKQLQDKLAMSGDYEKARQMADKLKGENSVLLSEVQKNANVGAEKERMSGDLKQAKLQLQESQRRCAELESKVGEYNHHSESVKQQQVENENKYRQQITEHSHTIQQMQQNYAVLNGECQKVKSELQANQNDSTKLLQQYTSLTEEHDTKVEVQRNLEQRLTENEQQLADKDSKIQDATKVNSELSAQVQNLEQQIAHLNSQIVKVEQETKVKADADTKSVKDTEEFETAKNENKKLIDELAASKKKNNDLRERNWKAMDALSDLEKTIQGKVTAAKDEGDVRCAQLEQSVKQSLKDAFPDTSSNEKNFEAWVKAFVNSVVATESSQIVQSTESSSEIEEAKLQVQQLHSQLEKSNDEASRLKVEMEELKSSVTSAESDKKSLEEKEEELSNAHNECEKYKNILNTTEEILSKLQKSVEAEEGVWKTKVQEAHQEASKAHTDAEDLRKTIEDLKSEKSSLQKNLKNSEDLESRLEKMTNKVSELEGQLVSQEPSQITDNGDYDDVEDVAQIIENSLPRVPSIDKIQQCDDTPKKTVSCQSESPVQVQYSDACTETGAALQQDQDMDGFLVIEHVDMNEHDKSTALINGYKDEVAKLKERLEKEKKLTKDLGQAASKLNTVLKQTQEQLIEEKEKSNDLQQKTVTENNVQK